MYEEKSKMKLFNKERITDFRTITGVWIIWLRLVLEIIGASVVVGLLMFLLFRIF